MGHKAEENSLQSFRFNSPGSEDPFGLKKTDGSITEDIHPRS